MDILIELLKFVGIVVSGCLSITLFFIAWKVFKCPDSLWKEMQTTPHNRSFYLWERFWNN